MASLNIRAVNISKTHEGAPASPKITPEQQLRRSVMSCLLWEDQFYEDGKSITERINDTARLCNPHFVGRLAVETRTSGNLRHVPLLLLCSLLGHPQKITEGPKKSDYIAETIQRADELSELLAIYWRVNGSGKRPLAAQLKKGLARAFTKFSTYSLAKYNRKDKEIKLRDVLFLCHAKPKDNEQAETWKQLIDGTLPTPDTWEVELSAGKNKRETFERLIKEEKLGYLALLRNLRNMSEAGCDQTLVSNAIIARKNGADRVLPFRYVAAARAAPQFEPPIDLALQSAIKELPRLPGTTVVLVDVSGSMDHALSSKSDMRRIDAAAALGAIINCDSLRLFSFSNSLVEVPPRRGMAGVDAIVHSQAHGGTYLGNALHNVYNITVGFDRIIVITDEQSADALPELPINIKTGERAKAYVINVASYQNGIGVAGRWVKIDGFSERVLTFIHEIEQDQSQ